MIIAENKATFTAHFTVIIFENAENNLIFAANNADIMRKIYVWQQDNWPAFSWDKDAVSASLGKVRQKQGHLVGRISALGFEVQNNSALEAMTQEVISSSAIEGVNLNPESVRSSIARHLGLEIEGIKESDHYTDGIVQIAIDAVRNYKEALTESRLFNWHAALLPSGRSGVFPITVAAYRVGEDPMQVISGAFGKEKIHYEAPASADVPAMMNGLLAWINTNDDIDDVLKAAIAHLWFVSIHPFDDGNGRITRTITDMLLARADGMPHRYYSMSASINNMKSEYYDILEKTQKGNLDITEWLLGFLKCLEAAVDSTEKVIDKVIEKAVFWERCRHIPMNERQTKMVNMLWDGFEGKLKSSKWAKICKCSEDTALRDISFLVDEGVLRKSEEGGRSTNYELNL